MKRILKSLVAGAALALILSPAARADALMRIAVGGTIIACDTSQTFSGENCSTSAGFVAIANGNRIDFIGTVNGVSFGNAAAQTGGLQLSSNQPGTASAGFVHIDNVSMINASGSGKSIGIGFGVNGFLDPSGSLLQLTANTEIDVITSPMVVAPAFATLGGWGNPANTLIIGGSTVSATPLCVAPGGAGTSCSTDTFSSPAAFVRSGAFALSGACEG